MTEMVQRQWHGHMVVVEEYVVQSLTYWTRIAPHGWFISLMPLSVLMLVHVRGCMWLIFFFMCNFTEEPITSSDSECVTVFVTTFVNMDIGKTWLNAPKNSQNKRLAHSWDLTRSFACCLICSQVHLPCLLGTFGVYEICERSLKNWLLCDYLD